ncbi:MAG: hypothetical protein AAF467_03720 [Actinomycetota bacterium]
MFRRLPGLLLAAGSIAIIPAIAPVAADARSAKTAVPTATITWVDLVVDAGVEPQGSPAPGATVVDDRPIEVGSVTVNDDGLVTLVPADVAVRVTNVAVPPDVQGIAAVENGTVTGLGSLAFLDAASRVMASADLRDQVVVEGLTRPASEWGFDYDIRYAAPLSAAHHLLLQGRDGNGPIVLSALDVAGRPLSSVAPIELDAGAGWNTGYAPASQGAPRAVRLSVVDLADVLAASEANAIYGFRVNNDSEADINLTVLVRGAPLVGPADEPIEVVATDSPPSAAVEFTRTVHPGVGDGRACPGTTPITEASPDGTVTYCYTVTNTGSDHLTAISISDPHVASAVTALDVDPGPLAPGGSRLFVAVGPPPPDSADGAVDDVRLSAASVVAIPADPTGLVIEGRPEVTANAETVVVEPTGPVVAAVVDAAAYLGHDDAAACPGANPVAVQPDRPLTSCYVVTNTGDTHLQIVHIDVDSTWRPELASGDPTAVAPGAAATFWLNGSTPPDFAAPLVLTATMVANPVAADGSDLVGLADVTVHGTLQISPAAAADAEVDAMVTAAEATPTEADAATEGEPSGDGTAPVTAGQTDDGAPTELAFTGWESWMLIVGGIGLVAAGIATVQEVQYRRRTTGAAQPIPARVEPPRIRRRSIDQ